MKVRVFCPQRRIALAAVGLCLGILAVVPAACLYDEANRCGPLQEHTTRGFCACVPGAAKDPSDNRVCVLCDETEQATPNGCACADGLVRDAASGDCVEDPSGLGLECTGPDACDDPEFGHCQLDGAAVGYCTSSGCSDSSQCPEGFSCEVAGSPAFCKRPPTGLGTPCVDEGDCEGFEASYCETVFVRQCLVRGCSMAPDDCHEGWECCDLSSLGFDDTLCLPAGDCPTSAR